MPTRKPSRLNAPYNLRRLLRNDQLLLGILAIVTGVISGGMVVGFRQGILLFHGASFNAPTERLFQYIEHLPAWQIVLVPTLGGLVVGVLIKYTLPEARPQGVADVVEAFALKDGQMSAKTGLVVAFINMLSIGVGTSVGREGPAVHLGAALSAAVANRFHLATPLARTILACGVGAAVAASFNAPIAGALFAGEVVIGHYALKAFGPVVLAAVSGTMVSRAYYGDFPAFVVPPHDVISYFFFPNFIVLGMLAGVCATIALRGIFKTQEFAENLPIPTWSHPALGGFAIGLMALVLPQVLGVGYGSTELALHGGMALGLMLAVLVGKLLATVVSLGFGFGGGIFSPSLMIGAMLGGAYGVGVATLFPGLEMGAGGYALIGMGAVAAATLGAPISTTLVIFEMTGDYQLTLGVMMAVVTSTVVAKQFLGQDFFTLQLERRGLDLKGGYATQILQALKISDVLEATTPTIPPHMPLCEVRCNLQKSLDGKLFVVGSEDGKIAGTIRLVELQDMAFTDAHDGTKVAADVMCRRPPLLCRGDDLQCALKKMNDSGENLIAVVEDMEQQKFLGTVEHMHVLSAYNRALLSRRNEELDQ